MYVISRASDDLRKKLIFFHDKGWFQRPPPVILARAKVITLTSLAP